MANPSPQHNPTDGLNTAAQIIVSGTGITALVAGRQYQVPLNVGASPNPASVVVTGTVKDATAANTFTSGNSNAVTLKSDNPSVASVSGTTITAVAKGQAVVDVRFPTFDTTDAVDFIYAQILVSVGA